MQQKSIFVQVNFSGLNSGVTQEKSQILPLKVNQNLVTSLFD